MSPMGIKPLLGEMPLLPAHFCCTTPERHKHEAAYRSEACPNCRPIRSVEKTERMATLTMVQYWVLQFIYWNPDCRTDDFDADTNLASVSLERRLVAAGGLVEKGLLTCGRDDSDRFRWNPTDQSVDFLDIS